MKNPNIRSPARSILVLLLLFLSTTLVQASPLPQEPQPHNPALDCRECHEDIFTRWEQSAHGRGLSCGQCHLADEASHARQGHAAEGGTQACMSCHTTGYDPVTDTWVADDVSCLACHTPIDPDHPDVPAPTDRSADLCGQCHIQANFEWQNSPHGKADVACVSCHSQHTTSLIASNVSAQCANCHETHTEGFTYSVHYAEGLSCANCHLAPQTGPVGEGSAKRHHTFNVDISTCVACHGNEMHNAADRTGSSSHFSYQPGTLDSTEAMASSATAKVSPEPEGVSPFGFVTVGGVTLGLGVGGVVVGMATVVVPWVSQTYRRFRRRGV